MSPQVDLNAIKVHFEIIGERPKYHVTAKNHKTGKVINEWFSKDEILSKVQEWTDQGFTIWVSFNGIEEGNDSIEGVTKFCVLWFDIDSKRADKSKPATDEEKEEAYKRAERLKDYIEKEYKALGFLALSGNGVHLFFSLPCYPLIGAQFRKEVNEKLRKFAKRVSSQADVEIDNTYDLRRVSTIIGTYNQKIPDNPLSTTWRKDFYDPSNLDKTLEIVRTARKINEKLLEAILNEPISTPPIITQADADFTPETSAKLLEARSKDPKLDALLKGEISAYGNDRSDAEMALVTKLVFYGFTKTQVFYIMQNISQIGKWKEKDEKYWNLTYDKAVRFNEEHKPEEIKTETKANAKVKANETEPITRDISKVEFGLADGVLFERLETPSVIVTIHKGKIKFSREGKEVEADFTTDEDNLEEELEKNGVSAEDISLFKRIYGEGVRRKLLFTKMEGETLPEFATKISKIFLTLFHIVTLEETDEILFYSKGVYKAGAESLLTKQIESIAPPDAITTNLVEEALGHVRRATYVSRERFNSDPYVLNVLNGLLDLRTFELKKHTHKFLSTIQLPVNYDPNAKCELWEKVVSEDLYPEDIPVLQEAFGYALYPENIAQKMIIFLGEGNNGKSLILHVLESLIGKEHVATVSPQEIENNRFAISQLFGKLVNIFPDLPSAMLQSTGKLKALVSGDSLTMEEKFKKPFSFRNRAKFFFSANILPKTSDNTLAFYRRLVIVNFPKTFDANTADPSLPEKLTNEKELSGILNWSLKGLQRLKENGFRFSYKKSIEEIQEIYTRASNPVKAFLDEETVEDSEAYIVKQDLYEKYKDYVSKHKLSSPLSSVSFFINVQKYRKPKTERKTVGGERKWVFVGLRLKNEEEKEEEENERLSTFSDDNSN